MKFANETPFGARLLRTEIVEGRMLNAAIARVRYAILPNGKLEPLPYAEQREDIRVETVALGEYGELQPDLVHPRTGVGVIVLGDVVPEEPVRQTEVKLEAGPYSLKLQVSGQRVWDRGAIVGLSPTKPTLFSRMPLSWSNAYGGSAHSEHGELPFPKNPQGKGFIVFDKYAVGVQLPNVEFADRPIKRWDDRPDPAGTSPYPTQWGMRTERVMVPDPEGETLRYFPERGMFDHAVPYLSGKSFEPDAEVSAADEAPPHQVRIEGVRAEPIVFELPRCPFVVAATIGNSQYEQPLRLEEIVVDLRRVEDERDGPPPASQQVSSAEPHAEGETSDSVAASDDEPSAIDEQQHEPRYRNIVELCFRRSFHYAYVPRQRRKAWLRLQKLS